MLEVYRTLKIFISFPGDVDEERKIAEEVIEEVNLRCRETLGIHLEPFSWHNMIPNAPETTVQQEINTMMEQCNAFLLLLFKRYGSREPGWKKSNTEREIKCALRMKSNNRDMPFLSYFKEIQDNNDQGEQEQKVRKLRTNLGKSGIIYKVFKTSTEFRDRLTHDLYQTVLQFHVSFSKRTILSRFWQLGIPEGKANAPFVGIYPPVDRNFMPEMKPDKWWEQRLVPFMVFEDFKALQKIEKTLRVVGYRDCSFRSITNLPGDLRDVNRMWICLPRSPGAEEQLKIYSNSGRARFSFMNTARGRIIGWRPSAGISHEIKIASPLSQYLELQRRSKPGGIWTHEHGRIFAKDYAILARFTDRREGGKAMVEGTLKDFFLAGIRGLGTWGAGWFLDRCYHALEGPCQRRDCDVQLVLEVTYLNESIHGVRVVSNESQHYFDNENRPETIKEYVDASSRLN